MPTSKTDIYYTAGRDAYAQGMALADKPIQFLTQAWEVGWLDALADDVRALKKK